MEFLGGIIGSIVGEIAKYIVVPIGQQLGYLVYYNHNIKNLEADKEKLKEKKTGVEDARRNLQILSPEVESWKGKVDHLGEKIREFFEEEMKSNKKSLNNMCPNPKSRYSLSKKAAKVNQEVLALLQEARNFSQIALPGPPPALGSIFNTEAIKNFESRLSVMNNVWEALEDDKLSMISLCGMGGVGKTTMVKKLVKRLETDKLFGKVTMAVVSRNPDMKRIQADIASCLGLELNHDESAVGRAMKLCQIIRNSNERILFILDDVWSEVDIESIGIPLANGSKGYKIMLTSRKEAVCSKMGSQKNFTIGVLLDEEAWDLFKELAGISDNLHFDQTAKEVARECGGLPIAIVTVAKALKNKGQSCWKDVLRQLRSSNLENIGEKESNVFSRIKLSYDLVQPEEAKSCLLLCCLFPEDYDIRVESLVRYGMGLGLFQDVDNFEEASNRVDMLISELKESFLLLDGDSYGCESVKMHDVTRDVGISIASKQEHKYVILHDAAMKRWPEIDSNAISLLCKEIKERLFDLEYPKLQLLWLEYQNSLKDLPDSFFEGMKELKVLFLNISGPLPKSFVLLKNLRTLSLGGFGSRDISAIGLLTNLEVLEIRDEGVQELPQEIARLGNLKVLDLRRMTRLRHIPTGVLSHLTKLEELRVYLDWESEVDGEKINASLSELGSLLKMTALETRIPEPWMLPKASIFKKLLRFSIIVGRGVRGGVSSHNLLLQRWDIINIRGSGLCALLGKTEHLSLFSIRNLLKLDELEEKSFPQLKTMWIRDCAELEYIGDARMEQKPHIKFPQLEKLELFLLTNLKAFWHIQFSKPDLVGRNPFRFLSLSNLREIDVTRCNRLKSLFLLSMAKELRQLQQISISWCKDMEGILCRKEVDDEKITEEEVEFPNLTCLYLDHLRSLIGFWVDMDNATASMVNLDGMEEANTSEIQQLNSSSGDQLEMILFPSPWLRFSSLQSLHLRFCDSLKVAFPPSVAKQLMQLQTLRIERCKKMKYIVGREEETHKPRRVFPMLSSEAIQSSSTVNQSSVESKNEAMKCCPTPRALIRRRRDNSTTKVRQHHVDFPSHNEHSHCRDEKMEAIVGKEDEDSNSDKIEFPHLKFIRLIDLHKLGSFYNGIAPMELPSLEVLEVKRCHEMKTFSCGSSLSTPKLKEINIEETKYPLMEDLNATVKEVMGTSIYIYGMKDLTRIEHDHRLPEDGELSKCLHLYIHNSNYLVNAIPSNLIGSLQNLEKLEARQCKSLEEIFEYRGVNNTKKGKAILTFSHLQEIHLEGLDNLKHIFNKIPKEIVGFQNLRKLSIYLCKSLQNIFSVSMASCMVQLQELHVNWCDELKEIVVKEDKDEEVFSSHKILFQQLRDIEIILCSNLECFYNGIYALEFPLLISLRLSGSGHMKTFSNGLVVSTPQLQRVTIDFEEHPLKGDLNTTLNGLSAWTANDICSECDDNVVEDEDDYTE